MRYRRTHPRCIPLRTSGFDGDFCATFSECEWKRGVACVPAWQSPLARAPRRFAPGKLSDFHSLEHMLHQLAQMPPVLDIRYNQQHAHLDICDPAVRHWPYCCVADQRHFCAERRDHHGQLAQQHVRQRHVPLQQHMDGERGGCLMREARKPTRFRASTAQGTSLRADARLKRSLARPLNRKWSANMHRPQGLSACVHDGAACPHT